MINARHTLPQETQQNVQHLSDRQEPQALMTGRDFGESALNTFGL